MTSDPHKAPLARIVVIGVTGRMGQALLRAAPGFPQLLITGAVASSASLALGRDAGEVAGLAPTNLIVTSDLTRVLADADVAIDFSHAGATGANVAACRAARKPLLIGTTGLDAALEPPIHAAAGEIALMVAPNTSIAVALLTELVRQSARTLPATFDIDVLELHHRTKHDAPSGTALALGRAAAGARGLPLPSGITTPAPGTAPQGRPEGQVGITSVRAGDIVGEHTVLFSGPGEQLSLTHRASDREIFARGALTAALWLMSQPPGRYDMRDFIGYKTST
ncbi:MAG TPA: 4-hydroxy-tetrahydrodipicolinate reductase [Steroidobacteraceae bacterium]|nr:4-hydroxy-tetrahydrodipicolinate reductase [Steroidobacteraceae bacterium]